MKKLIIPDNPEKFLHGSIVHWDRPITRIDPGGIKRRNVPVTCGICNARRFWRVDVLIKYIKKGIFTGCCKNCFHSLSWKDKNRNRPVNRKPNSSGYILIWNPHNPMANQRGEIYEHRLIMSEILGRPLQKWEHVHHKDRNRSNNHPSNLELLPNKDHIPIKDMIAHINYLENLLKNHNISF